MTVEITAPAEIALEARQGSPFHYVFQFFSDAAGTMPYDFTGWTFKMQLREGVADSGIPVETTLSSDGINPAISFIGAATDGTPELGGSPDPTNGMIYLYLQSSVTADLQAQKPPKAKQYPVVLTFYYDLEGTPPAGEPLALAYGAFTVACEVTRVA